ncbi:MAG: DNA repair protein RecO [Candidatus Peregrinibacteria bacterium]
MFFEELLSQISLLTSHLLNPASFITGHAVILASRPMNEVDVFLEIFSEEEGKMTLVAKGLRKKKSKLCGILQPFFCIAYERLHTRRPDGIPPLIRATLLAQPASDISCFALLSVASEVSRRFLFDHQPISPIFLLWEELIRAPQKNNMVLIGFFFRFFTGLGMFPSYKHCHQCGRGFTETEDTSVAFHTEDGVFHLACAPVDASPLSFPLLKTLFFASREPLENTACIRLKKSEEELLFLHLFAFIRTHSPTPLKSVEIWEEMRNFSGR